MPYDLLIIAADPDDTEALMGGTIAELTALGLHALSAILQTIQLRLYASHKLKRIALVNYVLSK